MIAFKPTGTLDLSSDPSILSDGDMQRCKNLRMHQSGSARLRAGSVRIGGTISNAKIYELIIQGGVRYAFTSAGIWRDETSIASGLTDARWSAFKYNAYNDATQSIFALNGTNRKRIEASSVYKWGMYVPTSAPTTAVGALTGLTGTYSAKITYCRKTGAVVECEGNPSAAGTDRDLTNGSLSVTFTPPADYSSYGITHARIYRTLANGSLYYHDQDKAITGGGAHNVDTNTADASLGDQVATDHDRPPLGSFCYGPNFNGTCFIIKDNRLYYSLPKQPEYWPADYYIEVSPLQNPGQCLVIWNGQPYYLTKNEIYLIQGTGHNSFFPIAMSALTGAYGPRLAVAVAGEGIYHVATDGLYLYNGSDIRISQTYFDELFRYSVTQTMGNGVKRITGLADAWLMVTRGKLFFQFSSYTAPSQSLTIEQLQNITQFLVYDLATKRVVYYEYPVYMLQAARYDGTNDRILAAMLYNYTYSGGFTYYAGILNIEAEAYTHDYDDGSIPDANWPSDTAISWDIESKEHTLSTRAHFPRWVKYDIDAASATTATGDLRLDGASHQTHTLSADRNTKRRLVATGNGERCSMRAYGTGPIEIYMIESE